MKSLTTDDFTTHVGIQLQTISGSILPKTVIRYAYYVFIFSLPFEGKIGGLSLLGLILAGVTMLQFRLFLQPAPKAFWWFALYLAVVAALGFLTILGTEQDTEFTSELIRQLFALSQLLVFVLIAYRLMMFESIAKRSLLILGLSCVLLAVLQTSGVIATEVHGRMTAFEDNPNVVALVLSVGLLCLLGSAHARKDTGLKFRLLAWISSVVLLVAIVNTGSRGSQLALALALGALIMRTTTLPQKVKTGLIVAAVIACLGWAIYQMDAARERWENTYYEGEVAGRDILMPIAWEMFLERPILGWGPVAHYDEMNMRTGDPDGGDPHNLYLWILKETGLSGGLPFLIGLWLAWLSVWKARASTHGSLPLALFLLLVVNNMKGTYLFFKIFWFVIAYSLASGTYAVARSEEEARSRSVRLRKTEALGSIS